MKRLIGALIILSIAVGGARFAYMKIIDLKFFKLTSIEVNCPDSFDKNKITKVSKLQIGESVFCQDYTAAANCLLALPGVEQVKVNRKLPSKVTIDIYGEEVVLFVKTVNLYGLTRAARIIDLNGLETVLPVVTGINERKKTSYSEKLRLCYALDLFRGLNRLSANLAGRLSEINVADPETAVMYFDPGGVKVVLPLRDYDTALLRLVLLDNKGVLGNSGSFDMTAGKVVIRNGV